MKKPIRLSRRTVYENPWVNLFVDRVELPGGRIIEEYHVIESNMEAVSVVMENASGEVLLVRVHRYPTDRLEWETPGGMMENGESIMDAARREALEETGCESTDHRRVYTFHPLNGISNKVFHVARCRAGQKVADPDPNEVAETRWFSRDEVRDLIRRNEVCGGFTLVALSLWLLDLT